MDHIDDLCIDTVEYDLSKLQVMDCNNLRRVF